MNSKILLLPLKNSSSLSTKTLRVWASRVAQVHGSGQAAVSEALSKKKDRLPVALIVTFPLGRVTRELELSGSSQWRTSSNISSISKLSLNQQTNIR